MGQYTGTGTFTQITTTAALTDGYYVFIADGTTNMAMSNTYVSSTYLQESAVTLTSGSIVNPTTANVWKIETNGTSKTIYNEASSRYVSFTGTSNNVQVVTTATTNNQKWNLVASSVFQLQMWH